MTAFEWEPEGTTAKFRLRTTWRRTVLKDWSKEGWKSWEEDSRKRFVWKKRVVVLSFYL